MPLTAQAMGATPVKNYDAIVIGADVNGLTAAALLARGGLSTCLVDPGEAAPSVEADWRAALVHPRPPIPVSIWRDLELYAHGLEPAPARARISLFETGERLRAFPDRAKTLAEWEDLGRDGSMADGFFDFIAQAHGYLAASRGSLSRGAGLPKDPSLGPLAAMACRPAADLLALFFESQALRAHLAAPAVFGARTGPFAHFSAADLIGAHAPDLWPERMPALRYRAALSAAGEAFGLERRYETGVDRIEERSGSVRLADGEELRGKALVIDAPAPEAMRMTGAEGPAGAARHRSDPYGVGLYHAKLSAAPAIDGDDLHDGVLYLADRLTDIESACDALRLRRLPHRAVLEVCFAPEAAGALTMSARIAFCGGGPALKDGDVFEPVWSDEERAGLRKRILDALTQRMPGLSDLVTDEELLLGEAAARYFGAAASPASAWERLASPATARAPGRVEIIDDRDAVGAAGAAAARRILTDVFKRSVS